MSFEWIQPWYNFELLTSICFAVFCNLHIVIAKRLSTTLNNIILLHGFTVIACNVSLLFQFPMTFSFVVCIIVICGPSNATFLRTIIRKCFWIRICRALFLKIDIWGSKKHLDSRTTSVIRKMKFKLILRREFTSVRFTIINQTVHKKWEERTLIHCLCKCNWYIIETTQKCRKKIAS